MHGKDEELPLHNEEYGGRGSEETESVFTPPETRQGPVNRHKKVIIRALLGVSLLFNVWNLLHDFVVSRSEVCTEYGFQTGFETDFKPARSAVKTRKILFDGSPQFYPNGTMYYPGRKNHPKYIGEPSQEIDDNWNALTRARYWALSEEEAIEAFGTSRYQEFWDPTTQGYIAGFDAQHTLHCLNFLRKSFYPEYYNNMSAVHGKIHRDHCIDHLRQLVQCQGDITPIPTRFREGLGRNYIDSDRWHTCRDWSFISHWVDQRYTESQKAIAAQTNGKVEWLP